MESAKLIIICVIITVSVGACKDTPTPQVIAAKTEKVIQEKTQIENDIDYAKFGIEEESVAGIGALPVGSQAPDFKTTDQDGNELILSALTANQQVVLVFYRGYWCPYCTKYLATYVDEMQAIKDKGALVIAIAPEGDMGREQSIEKTGLDIPFIVDSSNEIQKKYGVSFKVNEFYQEKFKNFKNKDLAEVNDQEEAYLPIPATYIIGKGGKIKWAHFDPDYSKRATVAEVLSKL